MWHLPLPVSFHTELWNKPIPSLLGSGFLCSFLFFFLFLNFIYNASMLVDGPPWFRFFYILMYNISRSLIGLACASCIKLYAGSQWFSTDEITSCYSVCPHGPTIKQTNKLFNWSCKFAFILWGLLHHPRVSHTLCVIFNWSRLWKIDYARNVYISSKVSQTRILG